MRIVDVEVHDKEEIIKLFALDKKIWPSGVNQNWYWFWRPKTTMERWVKVLSGSGTILASAHWSIRKDGTKNLKDIIVRPDMRGQNLGRLLMNEIGRPVVLKTDHDSDANGFYLALGLTPGETVPSKRGTKLLRVYRSPVEGSSPLAPGGS